MLPLDASEKETPLASLRHIEQSESIPNYAITTGAYVQGYARPLLYFSFPCWLAVRYPLRLVSRGPGMLAGR